MASRNGTISIERVEQLQRRRELIKALLEAAVRRTEKNLGRPLTQAEAEQLARLYSAPSADDLPQRPN